MPTYTQEQLSGAMDKAFAALSIDQRLLRGFAVAMIIQEARRALNADEKAGAEIKIREIANDRNMAIDLIGLDRSTPDDLMQKDKEIARMTVDSLAIIAYKLGGFRRH